MAWLRIKSGIQERRTECGERGEWGECYIPGNVAKHSGNVAKHSGECHKTFGGISPYIPGNVVKHTGKCHQTFREMSPNIPGNVAKHSGNVAKHSGECHKTFRGMSPNIPGNVIKNSGERRQTFQGMLPIFGVKGRVAFTILSNIHDGALLRK